MTVMKKLYSNEDMSGEKKKDKAYARRHEVPWSDFLIFSLLFAVIFFTIYMIETYQ